MFLVLFLPVNRRFCWYYNKYYDMFLMYLFLYIFI